MARHRHHLGIVGLVLSGIVGCSSVKIVPPPGGGTSSSAIQGATLANGSRTHIWVASLDGSREGVPAHGQYRLSPGRHTIRVQYYWTRGNLAWTGNEMVDYAFDAKAGASLRVVCEHAEESWRIQETQYRGTWKFWIEDASTGEIVAAEGPSQVMTREATGELVEPFFFMGYWN